jgi:lipid-A-disaccharide synthase
VIDVILTTNSPGEVSAWVKPVVKKLNELNIEKNIYVFTPPCVFSSGNEGKVISSIDGVTETYNSREYLKYILLNKKPSNFIPTNKGFVLSLGGDLMHAVFLGKKLDYPIYSYTEKGYGFKNSVDKFYLSDNKIYDKLKASGIPLSKLKVVGNLMFDSINPNLSSEETKQLLNKKEDEIIIELLPGSRPKEFKFTLPLLFNTVIEMNKKEKKYKYILNKSKFIGDKNIERTINSKSLKGKVIYDNDKNLFILNDNIEIQMYDKHPHSIMRESDFALTLPGTNNIELAALGTPMLIILPLNKPELIPLQGLIGLIGEIPLLGGFIKRSIIPKKVQKREYISLVNYLAEKEIVPEMVGEINSTDLSDKVINLVNNELDSIKYELNNLGFERGASEKIVLDILNDNSFSEINKF